MDTKLEVMKPEELTRRDSDIAGLCKSIVVKTACEIQGRKYVKVEGWMSIAAAHGCVASCRDVERVQGGFRAIAELKIIANNQVIATAEGFVGEDEPTWWGGDNGRGKTLPKRPDYAIRAMCQTRAVSRVCRSAFAHVVVLMDAGLSTTPAEEVPDGGFDNASPQSTSRPAPAAPADSQKPSDGVLIEDVMFESYKKVESKPESKTKWTAWFLTLAMQDGKTFEVGTFDAKLADNLDTLQGQIVTVSHKPGKKAQTRELISISPAAEV